ncbi:hypothetical protein AB3S75_027969 [Citrus x aurantiifolia]
MKLISWNVRGLGKDRTFREIKKILREHKPEIMFLCETKLRVQVMNKKAEALNFQQCFTVSSNGKGSVLAMMWSENVTIDIKSYSKHHIDAVAQSKVGSYWRCTSIYGQPKTDEKKHTWELIRRLLGLSSLLWLCFGDFNENLHLNEKIGGNDRKMKQLKDFREVIHASGLVDLGCKRYPFTWCNRRFFPHIVEERLDRAFYSKNWGSTFQELPVLHIETWSSDHYPIVMEVIERGKRVDYCKKSFPRAHYEDMWSLYEKYQEIVKKRWMEQCNWKSANVTELFVEAAKRLMADLTLWSSEEFGGREKKMKKLIKEL